MSTGLEQRQRAARERVSVFIGGSISGAAYGLRGALERRGNLPSVLDDALAVATDETLDAWREALGEIIEAATAVRAKLPTRGGQESGGRKLREPWLRRDGEDARPMGEEGFNRLRREVLGGAILRDQGMFDQALAEIREARAVQAGRRRGRVALDPVNKGKTTTMNRRRERIRHLLESKGIAPDSYSDWCDEEKRLWVASLTKALNSKELDFQVKESTVRTDLRELAKSR